jgi:hypothetical protein
MRYAFSESVLSLDLSALAPAVGELTGNTVGDEVPVYREAWGGPRGHS